MKQKRILVVDDEPSMRMPFLSVWKVVDMQQIQLSTVPRHWKSLQATCGIW